MFWSKCLIEDQISASKPGEFHNAEKDDSILPCFFYGCVTKILPLFISF